MTSPSPRPRVSASHPPTPFFLTTAIDYTNGAPHIGHAYEKVLADVMARYHRLCGREVFYLTGVDQHGQKVQQSAEMAGVSPTEFVTGITEKFVSLWEKLEVRYDAWAATTSSRHQECVKKILTRLNAEGQIYKDKRGGHYSIRQEQFLTDKERNAEGEFGPEWGEIEYREEENYYFKLAQHKTWLLDLLDRRSASGAPLVLPDFRVAELRNAVEKLDGDLCISRPKARLSWGIPFPFDPGFVTYVWFDALINYLSYAPGFDPASDADLEEFRRWWPATHVIGKDILIPAHGVYWLIMLKGLGFSDDEIPTLLVHGWWNIAGTKMSKSLGNHVDPEELADHYGVEALRYYLMSDIVTGRDADFSEERLVQRYNVDLANNLGNLLNRALNMVQKYRGGKLTLPDSDALAAPAGRCLTAYTESMAAYAPDAAVREILTLTTEANQFIEQKAPWKLAKDPELAGELDHVLYQVAETLRILAILLRPILPGAAEGIFGQLNWKEPFRNEDAAWGGLPDGHELGQPSPLFPRLEIRETGN
jgi:methionyl-tRNA synthetase